MNDTTWERRECVSAEVEQSLVLLDLDTLQYHSLNPTAGAIWELLAEPKSAAEIADALCGRYEVSPERCRESVDRMLQRFQEAGLISPHKAVATAGSAA